MTESLETLMNDDSNFTDDSKFSEMLALARSGDEPESSDAETPDEVEPDAIVEDAAPVAETPAPDQPAKELTESEMQSVKFFKEQTKREQARADALEQKLAEVTQFLQQKFAPQQEPQAFEPLDEDTYKWTQEQLKERDEKQAVIEQQLEAIQFQSALQHHEAQARAKYPDFDDAFKTYQSREIQRFEVLGYPKEIAAQEAIKAMTGLAKAALKQGRDIGDMFYGLAQSYGHTPSAAKPAKATPDLDALERNQARTQKKSADTITPDSGGYKTLDDLMKKKYNPRAADADEQFKKILAQARASAAQ